MKKRKPPTPGESTLARRFLVQVAFSRKTPPERTWVRSCGVRVGGAASEHLIDQSGHLTDLGIARNDARAGRGRLSCVGAAMSRIDSGVGRRTPSCGSSCRPPGNSLTSTAAASSSKATAIRKPPRANAGNLRPTYPVQQMFEASGWRRSNTMPGSS